MLGSARGRLGYLAWPNLLIYGTAGLAWTRLVQGADVSFVVTSTSGSPISIAVTESRSTASWRFGAVAGVGLESRLGDSNWLGRVEYLHYDFGLNDNNLNATFCNNGVCQPFGNFRLFDRDLTVDTVKLGVNYHLTSGYVPLK